MSAPNFWHGNTSNIFAVLYSKTIENEDGEMELYTPSEFDFEDLKNCIKDELDALPYDVYSVNNLQIDNRSYPASPLYKVVATKYFGDVEAKININTKIVNAYYDGASLDWELTFSDDNYDDYSDGADATLFYSDMNAGLKTIQKRNIESWYERESQKMISKIEDIFKSVSTPLSIDAIFSNGEAIYSKAV